MKMKNLLVFAMLLAYGAVMTQGSFWELQKMIKQVTTKSAFWNYYSYGCHCGLGGKGTPKDGTDQCCYLHDCCYERLNDHGCNAKFNSYSYVYLNGKIYCGMGSQCKRESCQCDERGTVRMRSPRVKKLHRFFTCHINILFICTSQQVLEQYPGSIGWLLRTVWTGPD
ncbi:unnamed protein product [Caretta caretta]